MDVVQVWVVKNATGPTLGVLEGKSASGPVWASKKWTWSSFGKQKADPVHFWLEKEPEWVQFWQAEMDRVQFLHRRIRFGGQKWPTWSICGDQIVDQIHFSRNKLDQWSTFCPVQIFCDTS